MEQWEGWEGDKGLPINLAWGPRRLNPALNLHVASIMSTLFSSIQLIIIIKTFSSIQLLHVFYLGNDVLQFNPISTEQITFRLSCYHFKLRARDICTIVMVLMVTLGVADLGSDGPESFCRRCLDFFA